MEYMEREELDEILNAISEAIGICDEHHEYGTGDRLYSAIDALKRAYGIDPDEE